MVMKKIAAVACATALLVGGTGTASAATAGYYVDQNSKVVSVTFKSTGISDSDVCGAVLAPVDAAAGIAAKLIAGDLNQTLQLLTGEDVIPLTKDGSPVALAVMNSTVTLSSPAVKDGIYSLITTCAKDPEPVLTVVSVGKTTTAVTGSLAGTGLDTLSSDSDLLTVLINQIIQAGSSQRD